MRSRWKAVGAILLAATLIAGGAAAPAAADHEEWQYGPVDLYVPVDTSAATAGIAAADIESITASNGSCSIPQTTSALWDGSGLVMFNVTRADTDAITCRVDVRVQYCDWNFVLRECGLVRWATVGATGGPAHVDSTPPTATIAVPQGTWPNAGGWFRTPGTIQWFGYDDESGIESCTSAPLGGPDTASRTLQGGCINRAHLSSIFAVPFTYKYDATPPALAPSAPSPLALGAEAYADPGATDATSGVGAASCNDGAPLDTSAAGEFTVSCTATDAAGNSAAAETTYTVGYGFSGFGDPVSTDEVNVVKAGRAIPLSFSVASDAAGTPVVDVDPAAVTVTVASLACDVGDTPNLVTESAAGASGLQNLGEGAYTFVWKSPKSYAGSCKVLQLDLGDGIPRTAEFAFTR
jgi:hypothetical protein